MEKLMGIFKQKCKMLLLSTTNRTKGAKDGEA